MGTNEQINEANRRREAREAAEKARKAAERERERKQREAELALGAGLASVAGDFQLHEGDAANIMALAEQANISFIDLIAVPRFGGPQKPVAPELIGVVASHLHYLSRKAADDTLSSDTGLTVTSDTTTYSDRAVVSVLNARGFDVRLTDLALNGKRVMRYTGTFVNDFLKRDDDIRRNGESILTVQNNYIVNPTQVDKIADYWFKYFLYPKHVYSVRIAGVAPWYSLGEWYTLQLGFADTNEYIDSIVECYSMQCERVNGTIGQTVCLFREVSENWAKTTLYNARATLSGSPNRRVRRSNVITVASSTFFGPYDFRCDGTDDDVQIQAAIDELAAIGGGTIQLTRGIYNISSTITLCNNLVLVGHGTSTVLTLAAVDLDYFIIAFGKTGIAIRNLSINGNKANYVITEQVHTVIWCNSSDTTMAIDNVSIYDFKMQSSQGGILTLYGVYTGSNISRVTISGMEAINNTTSAGSASVCIGVYTCNHVETCSVSDIYVSGGFAGNEHCVGYDLSSYINNCSYVNTIDSINIGFADCLYLSICSSSVAGAVNQQGYGRCYNVMASSAEGNSVGTGFYKCKQVQQCVATNCASPYGTGVTQSYSDAGTNACANTANGGFNS